MSINISAQEALVVEPLYDLNPFNSVKEGIQADKTIADGTRIIYAHSILPFTKHVNGDKKRSFLYDPIAVDREGVIMYGFSVRGNLGTPTAIKTGGKALIKTSDEKTYNATILYGCPSETHASSKIHPNLMGGAPISSTTSSSLCFAHIVMPESIFTEIIKCDIEKIRLETEVSQLDTELKGGKLQKQLSKNYPILKEAIQKKSSGFDEGF